MAHTLSTDFSLWRPRFNRTPLYVGFVMDKMTVGYVSLPSTSILHYSIIPQILYSHSFIVALGNFTKQLCR
jgi:hypothetical protein